MPKVKKQTIKEEGRKPKTGASIPKKLQKYSVDSVGDESSNRASSHSPARIAKKTQLTTLVMKNHEFKEIEGLSFDQDGEPIYHIAFTVKGKEKEEKDEIEKFKCTTSDIHFLEDFLNKPLGMDFLKSLLSASRTDFTQQEKAIMEAQALQDAIEIDS